MSKEMVISANPHETRVAIMEEGLLCEYYVEREKEFALVGSIYKGVSHACCQACNRPLSISGSIATPSCTSPTSLKVSRSSTITSPPPTIRIPRRLTMALRPLPRRPAPYCLPSNSQAMSPSHRIPARSTKYRRHRRSSPETLPVTAAAAASINSRPSPPSAPHDRGNFENRNSRPGRDFGRRGGGGRGRGGRFGRHGGSGGSGGRGGDRRFGRELPPSKYASSRPFEDVPSEPGAPEGHVSIILPENLSQNIAKSRR